MEVLRLFLEPELDRFLGDKMKGKIIGIGIVAVIICAALFLIVSTGDGLWNEPNEIGEWGQEIILTYADGTSGSFKIIQDGQNNPFIIKNAGVTITSITYNLKASATGDFTTVQIKNKATNTEFQMWTKLHSGTTWTIVDTATPLAIDVSVPVTGVMTTVYTKTWQCSAIESQVPTGDFDLRFQFAGDFEYKANGQTAFTTLAQPTPLIITLTKSTQLSIIWSQTAP